MYKKNLEIIGIGDFSLTQAAKKGNLGYAEEIFNPINFFKTIHLISHNPNDKDVKLKNPTLKVHTFTMVLCWLPAIKWIVNGFLALVQIFHIARKYKVCLIRGYAPYHRSLLGLIVSKLLRIPFVVSIGGDHRLANKLAGKYPVFNSRFLSEREEEIVLRGADMVICPNQYSQKYVVSLGVSTKRTCVIPKSLERDFFYFTCKQTGILGKEGIDINRPIILCVARLEGDKQVDKLIEAIPLVTKDAPEVQFVVIGDGSLRAGMEQRVAEFRQEKTVSFLGYQPGDIIRYCLTCSTAVVIPMTGYVVYEAAAAGKAIIAFDIEWHSEFVKDGETGLLVENRNCEQLAEAIKKLVRDPVLAELLGKNARSLLETEYNPKKIAEEEIKKLLEVIYKSS